MRKTFLIPLTVICAVLVIFLLSTRPTYTATFEYNQGMTVKVEIRKIKILGISLFSSAKFTQKLIVCWESKWFCNKLKYAPKFDGRLGGNIYLDTIGNLIFVHKLGMARIDRGVALNIYSVSSQDDTIMRSRDFPWNCGSEPNGPLATGNEFPSSLYYNELVYLGAFQFPVDRRNKNQGFNFLPASVMGERLCHYPQHQ